MAQRAIRKASILYLIFAAVVGCGKSQTLPISEPKLVEILTDVHIAEAAMEGFTAVERDSMANRFYQDIFTIHQVEQADFDSSLARLMKDPELFKAMYEKVAANIELRQSELGISGNSSEAEEEN